MSYILVKHGLKNYGKDKELWYHPYQGQTYPLFMETKKGYLVHREEEFGTKTWLIRKGHSELLNGEILNNKDDDIV